MAINPDDLNVVNNEAKQRYEVEVDGQMAFAQYSIAGKNVVFTHTEVPVELEGRGIASKLAQVALDDVVARGMKIQPLCPFIRNYVKNHAQYQPHSWGF